VEGVTVASLLREIEAVPASYPTITPFLRPAPIGDPDHPEAAPNLALAWQRIERFTGWRWSARAVAWVVEGPGIFVPRLEPFTVSTVEAWGDATGWSVATVAPTAEGGFSLGAGQWRISGTVGADAGAVPEAVAEAVRRLVEFNLGIADSWKSEVADYSHEGTQRPAAWAAKAIHLSGAADLLRPWRRLGAW
jgi:hypothetical protein